jgi:hypothetical protein
MGVYNEKGVKHQKFYYIQGNPKAAGDDAKKSV